MLGKSGGLAGSKIFIHAVAAQGDARQTVAFSQFAHQIKSAPVRKPKVADYQIEAAMLSELFGGRQGIRVTDIVSTSFQQPQQDSRGITVVLD